MEEKKNKCPLCSKRLVMKGGVPTCPDCGYRDPYRSGSGQSQADYNQQPRMSYGQPNYGQPSQAGSQPQPGYSQSSQAGRGQQQPGYGQPSQAGRGQQQPNYGQSSQANNSRQPNYGQPNNQQQPQTRPYTAMSGPSANPTKKQVNPGAIAIIVVFTIIAVISIASVVVGLVFSALAVGDQDGLEWSAHWETTIGASSSTVEEEESSVQHGPSDVSHLIFETPQSDLLKEFVSQLFDKPAASATREDLNSVIGLDIREMYNNSGTEVIYELSDGTTGSCYLASTRVDSADFKCFPKLQALDMGRNSLDWDTNWHNLTSLTSLSCKATPEELAGYMDVSQLTSLELTCDFMMNDCSEMGAYSNLEYLKLDCDNYYSIELTGISQAAALKTLVIEDGDAVSDFEELYDMTQLKELSIESKGLKDIGFIRDMSELESLELAGTQLMQITAISDRADTLKCLRLHRNNSVEDYSPVFECTGLEELELYVDYDTNADMVMPDLSMMSGLKVLTLGNYDRFPGLGNLTTLENLSLIDGGYFSDAGALAGVENLTNLKTLSLIDMSATPVLLEAFAGVTSLEAIDLTDTFIWGDINVVFGMPNLKVLNLEDADFGLNLEGMPVCESLLELNMDDTRVHQLKEDGSWDYSAGNTQISLGDHTEFFDRMPGLTALTVPGQELQDVKFAENLEQLTYLNISNNYVTDLSPLARLKQLKVVLCENNPVHDMTGLKNVIIID